MSFEASIVLEALAVEFELVWAEFLLGVLFWAFFLKHESWTRLLCMITIVDRYMYFGTFLIPKSFTLRSWLITKSIRVVFQLALWIFTLRIQIFTEALIMFLIYRFRRLDWRSLYRLVSGLWFWSLGLYRLILCLFVSLFRWMVVFAIRIMAVWT